MASSRMLQPASIDIDAAARYYQLTLYLKSAEEIQIGRLGRFLFQAGFYIYTGSAKKGISSRVARHLRKEKKLRWHIDYLLERAEVVDVAVFGDDKSECELASLALSRPTAEVPAKGFGASDCRCESHLVYLGNELDC